MPALKSGQFGKYDIISFNIHEMIVSMLVSQARIAVKPMWSAVVLKKHGTMNTTVILNNKHGGDGDKIGGLGE